MKRSPGHRGFTLVELLVAGLITTFIVGTISVSLGQVSNAKSSSRKQLESYLRADAALSAIRRDIATTLRRADLFWTRLMLIDGTVSSPLGHLDSDEILVFDMRLRPTRTVDYIGEGMEYETQYRIEEDDLGPVLWRRRDSVPDEYLLGGGMAVPLVAGIVSLKMEVYDGYLWYEDWDSDFDGLPVAVRVTVIASGHRDGEDPFEAPLATLRTVIALDRIPVPGDLVVPEEQELAADEEALDEAGNKLDQIDGGAGGADGFNGETGGVGGSRGGATGASGTGTQDTSTGGSGR